MGLVVHAPRAGHRLLVALCAHGPRVGLHPSWRSQDGLQEISCLYVCWLTTMECHPHVHRLRGRSALGCAPCLFPKILYCPGNDSRCCNSVVDRPSLQASLMKKLIIA